MQPALSDYTRLLDTILAGRNPRTLAAYQTDLEDYRHFMEAIPLDVPTAGDAVRLLLGGSERLANSEADRYRSKMIKRGLPVTTMNRRLASLRSLVKLANTHGLVPWTLPVENVPVQPYRDTGGAGVQRVARDAPGRRCAVRAKGAARYGEVAAELARRGIRADQRITVTIEPAEPDDWITKARAYARPKVMAEGWTDADIDRIIKEERRAVQPHKG